MLGGMEEDPEVGEPPLAKFVGLDFGLPSNEDTLAMSVFEKNQNIIELKTLCDSCLGVYFLMRNRSWCSSCSAFTKDTCDVTFFFISAFFELLCILLYAYVFPRLQTVKYYRSRAAAEGSMTVAADLAAGGASSSEYEKDVEKPVQLQQQLTNRQLIAKNADYAFAIFVVYTLSLSIFPGFLSEDTGQHHLGSWYAITLIALFNVGDLLGRCIILIKRLRFSSRPGLVIAALSRFVFIPAFYFTAKYGSQGWMIMLCLLLGLSNGYLTVSIFVGAPKGYLGPEQNALGNILTLFLLLGLFAGVTLDWLWLIGKGW
ncbi:unnamed protein product [Sphagnum compactum]